MNTTETVTTAAPQPEYNPDSVRILDVTLCDVHGWVPGNVYDTVPRLKKVEGARDDNGFSIYVMSGKWNHPVQLYHYHYSLVSA